MSAALAATGQPRTAFGAFDAVCKRAFGHRLFTVLAWDGAADEVERIYSNRPVGYPVSARKRMGPTSWGQHVLKNAVGWMGVTAQDMRWAFPDHVLIASLGCGAYLSAPVRRNGAVNLLDVEFAYRPPDLDALDALAGLRVAPLLVR